MEFDPKDPQQQKIRETREKIGALQRELASHGVPMDLTGPRMAALLEFLLDQTEGASKARLDWELEWAENSLAGMEAIASKVRSQKLTDGVQMDPRILQQIANNGGRSPG